MSFILKCMRHSYSDMIARAGVLNRSGIVPFDTRIQSASTHKGRGVGFDTNIYVAPLNPNGISYR